MSKKKNEIYVNRMSAGATQLVAPLSVLPDKNVRFGMTSSSDRNRKYVSNSDLGVSSSQSICLSLFFFFSPRCFLSAISEASHFRGRGKGGNHPLLRSRDALRACVRNIVRCVFPSTEGGKVIRHVDCLRVRAHVGIAVPVSGVRKRETERETNSFENCRFNCHFVVRGFLFLFRLFVFLCASVVVLRTWRYSSSTRIDFLELVTRSWTFVRICETSNTCRFRLVVE